jgi:hypothetical protein
MPTKDALLKQLEEKKANLILAQKHCEERDENLAYENLTPTAQKDYEFKGHKARFALDDYYKSQEPRKKHFTPIDAEPEYFKLSQDDYVAFKWRQYKEAEKEFLEARLIHQPDVALEAAQEELRAAEKAVKTNKISSLQEEIVDCNTELHNLKFSSKLLELTRDIKKLTDSINEQKQIVTDQKGFCKGFMEEIDLLTAKKSEIEGRFLSRFFYTKELSEVKTRLKQVESQLSESRGLITAATQILENEQREPSPKRQALGQMNQEISDLEKTIQAKKAEIKKINSTPRQQVSENELAKKVAKEPDNILPTSPRR